MNTNTFIKFIRSCDFLPKFLKGKLLVLSGSLEPAMQSEIAKELEASAMRQVAIVKEGIQELQQISKSVRRDARRQKEMEERTKEQKKLPNFDDA